jgi:hypothetical protein
MTSARLQEVLEQFEKTQRRRNATRLRLETEAAAVAKFQADRQAYLDAALAKKGLNV